MTRSAEMDAGKLPPFPKPPLTVAASECLTGARVRYDGDHKREAMPHAALDGLYVFRAICPEVGIGLGVPRDPIRLAGDPRSPRARVVSEEAESRRDVTSALRAYADSQLPVLDEVDGYVFMQKSPSCGLSGVRLSGGPPAGRGVYARRVLVLKPALPAAQACQLFDPARRANFVMRTFVYAHWRRMRARGMTAAGLIAFHTAYKYLVMAHDVEAYRRIGNLLSDLSEGVENVVERYVADLLGALSRSASRTGHANALAHLQGYVSGGGNARKGLADLIAAYRLGKVPLSEPMSLLRRRLLESGAGYALNQTYLNPDLWAAIERAYNGPHAPASPPPG